MKYQPGHQPHRQFVIGMAGHIDHGKTALIEALTGVQTDRLKEEQERGITIDLGFAHFSDNVTIIDVPGHERLIKNMVAGVSTIDLVLFVVAADDGIMPQTREHLDIVRLLGIRRGIFVITKTDLVEKGWLNLVEEDLKRFLAENNFGDAPVIKASAITGQGIDEVRKELIAQLEMVPPRRDDGIFRLPVDRVFTVQGFGTVVTGSVLSGSASAGDELEVVPDNIPVRVRGIESHDRNLDTAGTGYRAALNLAGVEQGLLHRGQTITWPGIYQPVELLNARMQVLSNSPVPVRKQMRLRIHLHTAETLGRVLIPESDSIPPGETAFVQIRLEKPVYASFGDRFIIRQFSPQNTLGGGVVLQTNPVKYRKKYRDYFISVLQKLEDTDPRVRVVSVFSELEIKPKNRLQIVVEAGLLSTQIDTLLEELVKKGQIFPLEGGKETRYVSGKQLHAVLETIITHLENYHRKFPSRAGLRLPEIAGAVKGRYPEEVTRIAVQFGNRTNRLQERDDVIRSAAFQPAEDDKMADNLQKTETFYREAAFNPPPVSEIGGKLGIDHKSFQEILKLLRDRKQLIYIDQEIYYHSETINKVRQLLSDFFKEKSAISIGEFKALTGTTRKYAVPLLTYLDNQGYTIRNGNVREPGPALTG